MRVFQTGGLAVRQLSAVDYPLLAKWLSDASVLAFYEGRDNPYNLAQVEQVFGSKADRHVTSCIVNYDGTDIGYIQFYPVAADEKEKLGLTMSKTIYGMDQFIGDPSFWNRGLGTQLVTAMAQYLCQQLHANQVVMDPQTWNTRAIRCYEKAGFHKIKQLPRHEWHEGEWRDCWLMSYSLEGSDIF
jgi:aminoglycoside 6'-N-acetyltransferase